MTSQTSICIIKRTRENEVELMALLKRLLAVIGAARHSLTDYNFDETTNAFKQKETIKSVRKLDENIYLLDFKADYNIDELLRNGVDSISGLLKFVVDQLPVKHGEIKIGDYIGGGCSTFEAYTPDGDHTLGRNFDFKDAPCFIVWTHPENHYESISVVDTNFMAYGKSINKFNNRNSLQVLLSPYCCVDGLNDQGLSIAVLQLKTKPTRQTDASKLNIVTTAMIRGVLDTCASVDEAIEFISSYNMHDLLGCAYHYQIVDKTGKSVVVEYVSDKLYVYEEGGDKCGVSGSIFEDDGINLQYVTNFTVKKDIGNAKIEQHGEDRAETIVKVLDDKKGIMTELESMDLLSHVKLNYKHPKYPWNIVALWSAVYNTNRRTLKLAANMDYSKIYTFSVNRPCEVLETEAITESAYSAREWKYL